jgi:biotin carboxyl carrier protein
MRKLRITIDGKVFEVTVEILDEGTPQELLEATLNPVVQGPESPASPLPGTPSPPEISDPGFVRSPVAGKVVSLDVNPGDEVVKGDRLLTIEAMKMHNYVDASLAGKVTGIFVTLGSTVEKGQTLMRIS